MSAEIVLDSINPYTGVRLTTMKLVYPQNIHSHILTHRVFSRNSSSYRAITTKRILKENPSVYPIWTKEQKGMSGERLDMYEDKNKIAQADDIVYRMYKEVVKSCEDLQRLGIHHQNINDYLRPFETIEVLVSATDWSNFFKLRLDYDNVKPEMFQLALEMKSTMNQSKPEERLQHIPFVEEGEIVDSNEAYLLSAGRCARLSYMSYTDNSQKDIELGKKLLKNKHLSPFEHAAIAQDSDDYFSNFYTWQSHRNLKGY